MNKTILVSILAILGIFAVYSQIRINKIQNNLVIFKDVLSLQTEQSLLEIRNTHQEATRALQNTIESDLTLVANSISNDHVNKLKDQLNQLTLDISQQEDSLIKVQAEFDRAINGLPEHVELDKLNNYYGNKWREVTEFPYIIETFNTSQGALSFQKGHFTFAYLPSSRKLAWIKIGKKDSNENSELIKAWLNEAESAKIRLGYEEIYRTTKSADYGEYTEALFQKDDMYFKTFLQHQRVQGTYNRHSLQYTYYVETGSDARKQQYELEQYNKKLGS